MADVTTDAAINIDVDGTRIDKSVANVNKLDKSFDNLAKRGSGALANAFGNIAQGAAASVVPLGGMGRTVSNVAQLAYSLSPALGSVGIAAAALIGILEKKRISTEEVNAVLKLNREALELVADANVELSDKAKELIQVRDKAIQQELHEIELKIKLAEAGFREATIWDRLFGMLTAGSGVYTAIAATQGVVNISSNEQNKILAELIGKWAEYSKEIGTFTNIKKAADAQKELAEATARLNEENDKNLTAAYADSIKTQEENTRKLLDIEIQRQTLRAESQTTSDDAIVEAFHHILDAEQLMYEQRLVNANAFNGERQVIEAEWALTQEQIYAKMNQSLERFYASQVKTTKASAKLQVDVFGLVGNAFDRMINGQLKGQGGFAAFFVQTTGMAIQAVLEGYGKLWAAQATALALEPGRQAEAAAKARAAAMAGVASQLVGSLTNAAVNAITAENEKAAQSASNAGEAEVERRGRTTVSTGPTIINYTATFVNYAAIIDRGLFFELWDEANQRNLRIAGVRT